MRKDFLVDPYQVMEGRAAGAGGVLVIVRMLDRSRITALLDCAAMLKMFVLLEAFDAARSRSRARSAGGCARATTNRSSSASTVAISTSSRWICRDCINWRSTCRPRFAHVAESGVASLDDVRTVVDIGYHVALVGTTLMHSADPRKLLGEMLATGRERAMAVRTRKSRLRPDEDDECARGATRTNDLRYTPMSLWIKICGLTTEAGVQAALDAGVDAVGFVFAPSQRQVSAQRAAELARSVPAHVARVAVMLHPAQALLDEVWSVFRPDVLQTDIEDLDDAASARGAATDAGRAGGRVQRLRRCRRAILFEGPVSGAVKPPTGSAASQLARTRS